MWYGIRGKKEKKRSKRKKRVKRRKEEKEKVKRKKLNQRKEINSEKFIKKIIIIYKRKSKLQNNINIEKSNITYYSSIKKMEIFSLNNSHSTYDLRAYLPLRI